MTDAVWTPSPEFISTTNIAWLMNQAGVDSYDTLHAWSVTNRADYWEQAIRRLGIRFAQPYSQVMDLSHGIEAPRWLTGARLNIVESCFTAPSDSPAIVHQTEGGERRTLTVGELKMRTDQVASNLVRLGFKPGDALAILLPMTADSVALYLAIVKAGCVVVGIADSFPPKEIATRLRLANVRAIFTQDVLLRGGKTFPLYARVVEACDGSISAIVLPAAEKVSLPLRDRDCDWATFLQIDQAETAPFEAILREPDDTLNLLFSSGTTGEPKTIPWTQTTPIKCAADAHFHQNVKPGDVLVWPTNIGWMMGPWLIFAALLNRATIGLYCGTPTGRDFGQFVQDAKTTLLGVVPSLVRTWRDTGCMEGLDWSTIQVFSSTGECSRADDMRYLSTLAGGKPIIEYCGGTEIGGGYITGTVTLPCVPGTFNTPALGIDFVILDEAGNPADNGELFLVPPSLGLSTTLVNRDHHEVYFADTPPGPNGETLRRHGDQMEKLAGNYWRGHGRADDTMNLGGIKVSAAEIERVLLSVPNLTETAAIAVSPSGGPSQLVIYAVCPDPKAVNPAELTTALQNAIKRDLNPLFKIHDLVLIETLPRTASNKVMRRLLRDQYRGDSEERSLETEIAPQQSILLRGD
jgi:acetyl-CoA synthetase